MFEDYKSKYLDLHDKVKKDHSKKRVSILEDVDFELELIHRDDINVSYILKLLAEIKDTTDSEKQKKKKEVVDLIAVVIAVTSLFPNCCSKTHNALFE